MEHDLKEGSGQDGYRLSLLAAAYAESGDFQKAIETQKRAIGVGDRPLEGTLVKWMYALRLKPNELYLDGLLPTVIIRGFVLFVALLVACCQIGSSVKNLLFA